MKNPFSFLRQTIAPQYLGVDIGTNSVKIVEVEAGKELPRLTNYVVLENEMSLRRSNTAFQTSTLKLFEEEIVEFLKLAVNRLKPKSREVIASLPAFAAFMTVINFPRMAKTDLAKAVTFQAKQYIPLPTSEVALDWLKVGEYEDEKGTVFDQVLLVSVPNEHINRYQKLFKLVGLNLRALEIEPLSLARGLVGADPTPTAIVDIGNYATSISIVVGGNLKHSIQSDFSGSSLTQTLATSLSINPVRAEELKRERGIIATGPNYELSTILLPMLDAIINEVKRAQFTYESEFPNAPKLERIMLAGGGANLLGIEKYAAKQTGLPTVKAAPLTKFEYPAALDAIAGELNPILSVALGLTLREFI